MTDTAQIIEQASELSSLLENRDPTRVRGALHKQRKGPRELALLLSPGADALLEEIAKTARRITLARFGRTVQLYAPIYLSSYCRGSCPYCGFRADRKANRRSLTTSEVLTEASLVVSSGMRHILLVCGDAPRRMGTDFLLEVIRELKEITPSISVEVAPLDEESYRSLATAGVDGVTLYQETYDPKLYATYHAQGPKADYGFRLDALDRAGAAGIPKLVIGALWGLAPWRLEALRLGLHADYLQRKHWKSHVSFGLPRLHQVPPDFEIPHPLDDRSLVHLIVAMRVFLEDAGLILSTRESPKLREQLVPLGITQMSAGSKTEPGGYGTPGSSTDQFEVADHRSPGDVACALQKIGYDPVFKDWDRTIGGFHD
ncbi:MAG: 2-iminoacetate synthase ThiH [Deltaproteobacteria bacterium]|nr:2-iminoacetate synthase ThiH [Deltaproteobacteria bacterium]